MCDIYSVERWTKAYGEKPNFFWKTHIENAELHSLIEAMWKLPEAYPIHPPNLGQFKEMLGKPRMYSRIDEQERLEQLDVEPPRVETIRDFLDRAHKKADTETARREIQKCRDILDGKGVDLSDNPPLRVGQTWIHPTGTSAHQKWLKEQNREN